MLKNGSWASWRQFNSHQRGFLSSKTKQRRVSGIELLVELSCWGTTLNGITALVFMNQEEVQLAFIFFKTQNYFDPDDWEPAHAHTQVASLLTKRDRQAFSLTFTSLWFKSESQRESHHMQISHSLHSPVNLS